MNMLITSGATREPLDGVRFITNFSTGATGAALADAFRKAGHRAFYLHGQGAVLPETNGPLEEFFDFAGLDAALRRLLKSGGFDAVIHLAAVSDYSVAEIRAGKKRAKPGTAAKLDSGLDLTVRLRRNFKILDRLARYAGSKKIFIAGFKLTCTKSAKVRRKAGLELSLRPGVSLAVHNDMLDLRRGKRVFTLYSKGKPAGRCNAASALARRIISLQN
ncbi:MAG: phosphopantothenoylcysteine decarboxylase [Elusimicrobiales bacterium]|nr:phosphopantothenoylcysteine decarboxylase [Elusimicrobiales bacterium]